MVTFGTSPNMITNMVPHKNKTYVNNLIIGAKRNCPCIIAYKNLLEQHLFGKQYQYMYNHIGKNPEPLSEAIVNTKKQLKSALPDLKEIFKDVEHYISEEVSIIEASIHEGKSVIPEILYQDIENGNIDLDTIDLVKKRGCVVIRNVFSKSLIDEWNEDLGKYIIENGETKRKKVIK